MPKPEYITRKMTCNALIVLLRIYRGSFNGKKRRGTDLADLAYLLRRGLIEEPEQYEFHCTDAGNTYVKDLLAHAP